METTLLIIIVLAILLYFLPSIIGRNTQKASGIFVLNLFLGWTFLGWVIALVWAVSAEKIPTTSLRSNAPSNMSPILQPTNRFSDIIKKHEVVDERANELSRLSMKLMDGEAIIKNKITENYEIVTAEKWLKLIEAERHTDYELIEER